MKKILIIGGGSIGERHLRCFQALNGVEVSLVEPVETRRKMLCDQYKVKQAFASLGEAKQHWHGVVIASPAHMHVPQAIEVAQFTQRVLVEKPLSVSLDGVDELLRCYDDKSGRVARVAYVYRAHPAVRMLVQMIADGQLGNLLQVTAATGQQFARYRPAYAETYYADRKTGGGVIQDAATHLFDLVHHLAGPMDWIVCDHAHQQLPRVQVEDTMHLVGRCNRERVMVSLTMNQFMAPNVFAIQFNGDKASAELKLHEHKLGTIGVGEDTWKWTDPLIHERDELFKRQATLFMEESPTKPANLCTLHDAAQTLKVALAALASKGTQRIAI